VEIEVPFFIRFAELEKKIKEILGEEYIIVNLFQDESGKWQAVVERIYYGNQNIFLGKLPEKMIPLNIVLMDNHRN